MFLSLIGHKDKDKSDVLYIYRLLQLVFFPPGRCRIHTVFIEQLRSTNTACLISEKLIIKLKLKAAFLILL